MPELFTCKSVPLLSPKEIDNISGLYQKVFQEKPYINGTYVFKSTKAHLRLGSFYSKYTGYIRIFFFYINEDYRKRGLGSLFIKGLLNILKENCYINYIELQAKDQNSAKFWEKNGFFTPSKKNSGNNYYHYF